jgi:hypothetical protein
MEQTERHCRGQDEETVRGECGFRSGRPSLQIRSLPTSLVYFSSAPVA